MPSRPAKWEKTFGSPGLTRMDTPKIGGLMVKIPQFRPVTVSMEEVVGSSIWNGNKRTRNRNGKIRVCSIPMVDAWLASCRLLFIVAGPFQSS